MVCSGEAVLNELHLFAGAGGGILGGKLLGHRCVGAVEINPYCRRVLEQRQRDGVLEPFPIFDDVRAFDGKPWRGRVDVVCGGFPCQDISSAGKRAGLDGDRSSLWWEMHRIVREVEPRFVFVENVAALLVRGFDRVLGSLADLGFDAEWCVLSAAECGAPHLRQRLWLLAAHADQDNWWMEQVPRKEREAPLLAGVDGEAGRVARHADSISTSSIGDVPSWPATDTSRGRDAAHTDRDGEHAVAVDAEVGVPQEPRGVRWWESEPSVGRVADGVANRMDRLAATGNGQVPAVAATAFRILMERFDLG